MYIFTIMKKITSDNINYVDRFSLFAYANTFNDKEIDNLISEIIVLGFIVSAGKSQPRYDSNTTYPRYKVTDKAYEYVNYYKRNEFRNNISFYLSIVAILLSIYSAFLK